MKITSPDFRYNEKIPIIFTGDGENINPSLKIQDVTKDAKSLVLIVDDPDAPAGTWVHWIVFNISPKTTKIPENSIPGIQGKNSWSRDDYGGPHPPSGTHRYFFKIYALDTKLNLKEGSNIYELENVMKNHILDKAELVGLYR